MRKIISVLFFVLVVCNFTACEQGQACIQAYSCRDIHQQGYGRDEGPYPQGTAYSCN